MFLSKNQREALINGFYDNYVYKKWLFSTKKDQKLLNEYIEYYVCIYGEYKLLKEMNNVRNIEDAVTHFYFAIEDSFEEDFYEIEFDWIDKLKKLFPKQWEDADFDMAIFFKNINIGKFSSWDELIQSERFI